MQNFRPVIRNFSIYWKPLPCPYVHTLKAKKCARFRQVFAKQVYTEITK